MAPEPANIRKIRALRKGAIAEYRAVLALLLKGYRIAAFRYRTKLGEIDIIARKGDLVACIEVKARANIESAVTAVSPLSQRRIRAASNLWLARQPDATRLSIRYDIISVSPWRWPVHLIEAF
jgi:putative endonuclease